MTSVKKGEKEIDFLRDTWVLGRDAVPECGNFRIKTKMAVGIQGNVFASLKTKY